MAGAGVLLAAIAAGLFFSGKWPASSPAAGPAGNQGPQGITSAPSPQSPYAVALARAITWRADAVLASMILGDRGGTAWTFIFVSPRVAGRGFEVVMDGQAVISAQEIAFQGKGAPLPANVIAPDAALAVARAVPGMAGANIISLELSLDAASKQWFWGARTASGTTMTIKATH